MHPSSSGIVISGISGRYPECNNVEEFADALLKKCRPSNYRRQADNCIATVCFAECIDAPHDMGKIPEINKFDAAFFGVHPKQSDCMDPRQRVLNETIYECIIDAGVYVGIGNFSSMEQMRVLKSDGYVNIGVNSGQAANRASYVFDFKGPSYIVDTACSSSMHALSNAYHDIKEGRTDAALVCATHLCLHPYETLEFNRLNMLSAEGRCRVFSRLRDGYVRAEAVVSIFLQREAASRRMYAHLLGASINSDGYKKEGITYPSNVQQSALIRETFAEAGVDPEDIAYAEAHGTGTPAGDPEELTSLVNVFCKNRRKPLLVGAVKTNMGHPEVASGLCSDLKKILNEIFKYSIRQQIVTENTPWNGGTVALNSFGFGGANSHAVMRSNAKAKTDTYKPPKHRLVQVSGRTEEAVNHFLDGVARNQHDDEFLALVDEIHKMNVEGHNFRGYTVLGDKPIRQIDRYSKKRPIWFIYSGMGSQWVGMGRDLMQIEVFRNTIKRCAAALKPYNIDLEDILTSTSPKTFDSIMNSFCAIIAVEVALTDVLYSLGIVPDYFAGHSLGEVGCAYADGQITPEQAILLAYSRGYGTVSCEIPEGLMAAVALSKEECEKILPEGVIVACCNGKKSVTISGPVKATADFVEKISNQGVFARKVNSGGIAFHSKDIREAGSLLYEFAKGVLPDPKPRTSRWVSTSVPEHSKHATWANYNSAEYHRNNFCKPVLFNKIYDQMADNAIVIEIGPHGLLQAILKRELGPNVTNISLVNRASDDNELFFLSSIGKIFLAGGQPNLRNFYRGVTFPVSRGTKMLSPLVKWDHSVDWFVPLWRNKDWFGKEVTVNLSDEKYSYYQGHNIDGRVLMPATGYLVAVWEVLAEMRMKSIEETPLVVEEVKFKRATSGNFEIFEGGSVVCTGRISTLKDVTGEFTNPERPTVPKSSYLPLSKADIYKECRLRRYMYDGIFQGIAECDVFGLQGRIEWHQKFTSFLDTMLHLTVIADAQRNLKLPTSMEKLVIDPVEHLKQVSQEKEIPIFYNQVLNTIKAGAIEIIGMESTIAPRRQQTQEEPVLETYDFVPYENTIRTKLDIDTALLVVLQIILQNCKGLIKTPKICEVSRNNSAELTDKIRKMSDKQAMTAVEYSTYNPNNSKGQSYDAIVLTEEVVDEVDVETILLSLADDGFVLYLGEFPKIEKARLQIVYQAVTEARSVYLLRHKCHFPSDYAVINVRNGDFEWLNKLVQLVKGHGKKVVYLFGQGEETSGVVGLVKCLLTEPNEVKFRAVLVEDENAEKFSVDDEFYREQLAKGLAFNVLKGGRWGTFAHLPLSPVDNREIGDAAVTILTPGDLSTLSWMQKSSNYFKPTSQSELVHVFYASLNFKDVMIATAKLQNHLDIPVPTVPDVVIGFEYAGVTLGGRRVMGLTQLEALSLQLQTDPTFTWDVPDSWTLEEAATVPCVYATCYYAMILRGKMQPGESILIHAGTGGIGLAAISIALSMGCTVYTTVGSQEKRDYLIKTFPRLKPENIGNSRNTTFRRMIMQRTNKRGVDLVLNSLSAELFQASLKCIANQGRFLEIGKMDFVNESPINSKLFLKDCSFHGIHLDNLFVVYSKVKQSVKDLLDEGIKKGVVKPLPRTVFDETEIENAFRFLSTGKHKGKVVIRLRKEDPAVVASPARTISAIPSVYFDPKKSYILIGGLGGISLELANWMIRRGATKIVLNSRRNVSNGYQSYCLKKWERFSGITVRINVDDTSSLEGARELVGEAKQLGPVGGVFNMALVLRDAIIENQTRENFKEVFKAKHAGGGNIGQSNYGMANSALERLCEKRKREGLPGLAIQWGPVGDVGYVANNVVGDQVFHQISSQNIYSCLHTLETFMLQETAVGSSTVLVGKGQAVSSGASKTPAEVTAHIMGIRNIDLIEKGVSLSQMGLDSLMVAEIKQTLYRNYQLEFSIDEIRNFTFDHLISMGKTEESAQPTAPESDGINGINGLPLVNSIISKETIIEFNRDSNSKKTIFLIHPIEGQVEILRPIASQLKSTVYGLQCTQEADCDSINDYARYFIRQMRSKQPAGPYTLCGYSYGAVLALEMGLQLESEGERVTVISIDGSPVYVKSTLRDGFVRQGKSMDKSKMAILTNFSAAFSNVDHEKVLTLLENTAGWEKQIKAVSDIISKETGLPSAEVSISADRFYKRCHAAYFYEPNGVLRGKLLLIRRENNEYISVDDYDLQKRSRTGWASYRAYASPGALAGSVCKQKVEVLKLKGDHRSILLGENTKTISEKINEILLE
ncbi:hypothetical protein NQ318_011221 [Aromia moschata]|uniref:Fatty acid synthase n=1 Tax=Aromia moschata TaxID=1265417 RepID=A0AAV8YID8_9CUCU|nr:hypothetical protein NQ318_011221 [Aromia moschata]